MQKKIKMEYKALKIGIKDVQFGKNVKVVEPVNLYGCRIGDDTFVGPFVEIQRKVSIGKKCKIPVAFVYLRVGYYRRSLLYRAWSHVYQ